MRQPCAMQIATLGANRVADALPQFHEAFVYKLAHVQASFGLAGGLRLGLRITCEPIRGGVEIRSDGLV